MFAEDLSVFYNTAEFARPFTLWTGTQENVVFNAIFSVVDEDALQGYAVTAQYQLHYPTSAATLKKGDVLIDGADTYIVRSEPRRLNDGLESSVLLSRKDAPC